MIILNANIFHSLFACIKASVCNQDYQFDMIHFLELNFFLIKLKKEWIFNNIFMDTVDLAYFDELVHDIADF